MLANGHNTVRFVHCLHAAAVFDDQLCEIGLFKSRKSECLQRSPLSLSTDFQHICYSNTHTLRVEVGWETQLAYVLLRQNSMCLCVYVCLTCLHTKLLSPVRPYRSDPLLLLFSSTSLLHFAFSSSTSLPQLCSSPILSPAF